MAVMFLCMVFTIAELSAALPHAGGFYSFVRNALGPTAGFLCGVTDTIEYVLTPAVIVVGIGGYLHQLMPDVPPWVWWLAGYTLFVGINCYGAELSLQVGLVITALAVGVLVVFYACVLATGSFDSGLLFNVEPAEGQSAGGLPFGVYGIFAALPFAIWFYLAIEQLPLAAEETRDVVNDMPKALIWGILTLLALSLFTLVLNSGVGGGARAMMQSDAPLADGFQAILGTGASTVFILLALTGLVASFHTVIYAYGRVLFALSRAGYFPRWISLVNRRHCPHLALITGAVIGFLCALVIHFEKKHVGAALLNMAVFGAVISYALVMFSYIVLRLKRPHMNRPYRSPLGLPGALVGGILALVALVACFAEEEYRPGVVGTFVFVVACMLYYLLYSRRRLVARAPEEEVALIEQATHELER
jgi:ethanolamine permease